MAVMSSSDSHKLCKKYKKTTASQNRAFEEIDLCIIGIPEFVL